MSEYTTIEWCDHSWSPWRGCTKVSAGCAHCYAETLSKRNPAVLGQWGKGKPRVLAKNWVDPVKWNRNADFGHWKETAEADAHLSVEGPDYRRPTVFPSLCDWLDDEVPVEWLARFLKLIHDTPNLTWLLLTKRPENWAARINSVKAHALRKPNPPREHDDACAAAVAVHWLLGDFPGNVWIGASVEDQPNADRRIPELLKIPAAGRFLSLEPLLGPVNLGYRGAGGLLLDGAGNRMSPSEIAPNQVDWLIIGGESGHGARPCNVEWIRSPVKQGKTAGVATFVKQLGARPLLKPCRQHHFDWRHATSNADRPDDKLFTEDGDYWRVLLNHPKGGDPAEWPEDLRVREFPKGLR